MPAVHRASAGRGAHEDLRGQGVHVRGSHEVHCQMVGLQGIRQHVHHMGHMLAGPQGSKANGPQGAWLKARLGGQKAPGLGSASAVLELGADFVVVYLAPAKAHLGIGAVQLVEGTKDNLALHARGHFPLAEGRGPHGRKPVRMFPAKVGYLFVGKEKGDPYRMVVEPELVHQGPFHEGTVVVWHNERPLFGLADWPVLSCSAHCSSSPCLPS